MNYEPVSTERTFDFNNEDNTQKKSNTMNLWQMIICAVLLVSVTVSMFLPVFKINGKTIFKCGENLNSIFDETKELDSQEYEKKKEEDIKIIDEELEKMSVVPLISSWDIMTTNGVDKLIFSNTDAVNTDIFDDMILSAINSKYNHLRVGLWIIYMLALVLLIPLFLGYFLHWNKFIFSGIGAAYGLGGSILFGYLRFLMAGNIISSLIKTGSTMLSIVSEFFDIPDLGLAYESGAGMMKSSMVKAISNFYSLGFLVAFILSILVLGICVVTMFVGNEKANVVPVQDGPYDSGSMYDDEYNQRMAEIERQRQAEEEARRREEERIRREQQRKPKMGKVKCIAGVTVGQGFMLPADKKVVVGKSKVNANLIIDNPNVSNIHCSIRYNPAHNSYIVKDHSLNGTFVNGVKIQKDIAIEYPAGTVLSLADGSNQIKLG